MSAIKELKKLLAEAHKQQQQKQIIIETVVAKQVNDTSGPAKLADYLNKSQKNTGLSILPENIEAQRWNDPLTPLDQSFVTLKQMNDHYNLFVNRVQQQMSSVGGGGEVRLRYLDDIDRSTIADGLFLKYNSTKKKFEFANPAESADHSIYATVSYVNELKDRIISPNDAYITFIDDTGTTTFAGNVVPGANTHTLGTPEIPWKDLYISYGSLYIGDVNPVVDAVSLKNTDGYIVFSRGGLKVTDNTNSFETFQLDNTGKLILRSLQPASTTTPAVSLVGNTTGNQLPTSNLGVMLQATGTQDRPSRIYVDGIGVQSSGANAYAAYIGRSARGSASNPTQSLVNDIIVRFGGNAYATTLGVNSISNVRIDMVAAENQTITNRGSKIEFWTTPIGSAVPQRSAHINSSGIDLSESTDTNSGVTFKNGSLLKYWPSVTGNNTKVLRTDGTDFFWSNETVVSGSVVFKGAWSAEYPPSGGNPLISNATGMNGWEWIVSAAGTQDLGSGSVTYGVGDQIIHDGTKYIRIPAQSVQVAANWTETNSSLPAFIQNKPTLATVATSGSYLDLSSRPSIPAAQVQSDWTQSNNTNLDFIKNKPVVASTNTANAIVVRDANGDFSAGTISATRISFVSGTQSTPYLGTATTSQIGGVQPDGTSITISNGIISASVTGLNSFTSTVTTQSSTLTVDVANGPSVIFWQPATAGNRAVTLTNFSAGKSVKIFITPKANNNTFTFTSVTGSQCSNGSNAYQLASGGAAQSSMMIEIFSTTALIGGVWIDAHGGV